MIIKLFDLYRPDRSYKFKKEWVKRISYDQASDLLLKYQIDDSFNVKKRLGFIYDLVPDKIVSKPSIVWYKDPNKNNIEIKFNTNPYDLSWGGFDPGPKLDLKWVLILYPLNDEYYIIYYRIDRKNNNEYYSYASGYIMVDGEDNLESVINDMIENYDILSHHF